MTSESLDDADRLGLLVDAVFEQLERGEEPDVIALAARFRLDADLVADCLTGLRAMQGFSWEFRNLEPGETHEHKPDLPEDYEVLEELGRGGMGVVYRVHQRSLNREVAVKVLRPGDALVERALRRFEKEARSLARLRHPNIVTIHEVGRGDGQIYFSMDLIRGPSLRDLIRSGELTPTQTLKIVRQVVSAIAYTHEQGLIHRDLKPLNILLDERQKPYVSDFGLARRLDDEVELTRTGQLVGTPHYMSPEQARGETDRIAEPADIWALGALLYECLCGQPPFRGTSPMTVLHDVIHRRPVHPAKIKRSCPPALGAIALKALEKRPEDRYPTARAFLEDLERFDQGRRPHADRHDLARDTVRLVRRNLAELVTGLVVTAILAGTFIFTILPRLGNDPATMRNLAEDLWSDGAHDAAATAYESIPVDELNGDDRRRIVAGRLARSKFLLAEDKAPEARDLLAELSSRCSEWLAASVSEPEASASDSPTPFRLVDCREIDLHLALAICIASGAEEAERFVPRFHGHPNDPGWHAADGPLLAELLPFLDRPDRPESRWLDLRLARMNRDEIAEVVRRYPDQRSALSLQLVSSERTDILQGPQDFEKTIQFSDVDTCRAMAAIALDPARSINSRRLAAAYLEVALELPPRHSREEDDENSIAAVAWLARDELRRPRPFADHRARAEAALQAAARGSQPARSWLLAVLGIDLGEDEGEALLEDWLGSIHESGGRHRAGLRNGGRLRGTDTSLEPLSWQVLRLAPDTNNVELLRLLAHRDPAKRLAAHRLLRGRVSVECGWPLTAAGFPAVQGLWEELLARREASKRSYRCHVALFPVKNGVLDGCALRHESFEVPFLQRVDQEPDGHVLRIELDQKRSSDWTISPPGYLPLGTTSPPRHFEFSLRPALIWNEPEPVVLLQSVGSNIDEMRRSLELQGHMVGRVRTTNLMITAPELGVLPLVVVTHADQDFDGSSLDHWRRATLRNVEDGLERLRSGEASGFINSSEELLRLVAQIGLPEAIADLNPSYSSPVISR